MKRRAVAQEFIRAHRGERGDRVGEREKAGVGKAGGETEQVLLGHADVVEAVGKLLREGLEHGEAEIPGQQHHPRILAREANELGGELGSHERAPSVLGSSRSSSSIAWANC